MQLSFVLVLLLGTFQRPVCFIFSSLSQTMWAPDQSHRLPLFYVSRIFVYVTHTRCHLNVYHSVQIVAGEVTIKVKMTFLPSSLQRQRISNSRHWKLCDRREIIFLKLGLLFPPHDIYYYLSVYLSSAALSLVKKDFRLKHWLFVGWRNSVSAEHLFQWDRFGFHGFLTFFSIRTTRSIMYSWSTLIFSRR